MSTSVLKDLFRKLRENNIHISLDGEHIRLDSHYDEIPPSVIGEIRMNKEQIIGYLKANYGAYTGDIAPLERYDRGEYVPLSYSQERLWFIDQLQGSVNYHLPFLLKIRGGIDRSRLQEVFLQLLSCHEVLRTIYRERDGVPYQEVLSGNGWAVEYESFGGETGPDLQAYLSERIARPFDLSSDLPLRVWLIKTGPAEHLLLVVVHHIASDGWSNGILIRELLSLYRMAQQGLPIALPALRVQYADYAIWQRDNGERLIGSKLAYWEKQLGGAEILEMPTDHSRPAVQSARGASIRLHVEEELVERLQALSLDQGVTLFVTLLAAFNVLLYRYSGQYDLSVGTVIAHRPHSDLEGLIGFFVNTLVIRTDMSEIRDLRQLLAQLRQTTLEAYERQDVPFERVVDRLVSRRDMSRNPLFQVLFTFNNESPTPMYLEGIELEPLSFEGSATQFDLHFNIIPLGRELGIEILYCTDLYEERSIRQMGTHYCNLLQAAVQDIGVEIARMPMLSDGEVVQLTKGFNQTRVDYPADKTIVDLFEEQAAKVHGHTAVVFGEESLSYGELHERSDQLAHYLARQGVRENEVVGICIDRSLEMIVGILGILKTGAAYVPIDPDYPHQRITYMLADTSARFVLTTETLSLAVLSGVSAKPILLDSHWKEIAEGPVIVKPAGPLPNQLAYVMYTSGSTGDPKGVMIRHDGVVNRLLWAQRYFQLTGEDRVLQKTTYCFDVSVWELLWPLLAGARLVFARPGGQRDAGYLKKVIASSGITVIHFVPSLLEAFLETLEAADLRTLRSVLCSGEELKTHQAVRFREKVNHCALYNLYGPTEASVDVTCVKVSEDVKELSSIPIGKPIDNVTIYILDKQGQLVPPGVTGEIYIGGVQVAKGYWNKPDLTAERFIRDPFDDTKRECDDTGSKDDNRKRECDDTGSKGDNSKRDRLYRTGDLGKWRHDGNIDYLGRTDHQVKVRGYRIELGEIEAAIRQSGLVSQCAVLALPNGNGDKRLVGYVVSENDLNREGMEAILRQRLPEYMVPGSWVRIDALPLTTNGKVDRRSLAGLGVPEQPRAGYVGPINATEEKLAEIWQRLLGSERIGREDNFFEIGGHSLLVIRMVTAVKAQLGVQLSVGEVFRRPTIAGLAAVVEKELGIAAALPALVRQERGQYIPLSYTQERLWFVHQLQGSANYHLPFLLKIRGAIDRSRLQDVFLQLLLRHEVLRTVYRERDGIPYQGILSGEGWAVEYESFGEKEGPDLQTFISERIGRPFDLSSDLPLRVWLIRTKPAEHLLLVVVHHIAADGWSNAILIRELLSLYRMAQEGLPMELPALPVQYADYAIWQRANGEQLIGSKLAYWEKQLGGAEILEMPTDHSRPAVQSTRGASIRLPVGEELVERLQALSQEQGVTLFVTLLAAFKVMLYGYSGQQDLSVGSPVANRMEKEVEPLVGCFINTVVFRTRLSGLLSFEGLMQELRQITVEAYEHADVPFEQVIDRVSGRRDMSRSPLFQVLFTLNYNEQPARLQMEGVELEELPLKETTTKYDLHFDIVPAGRELEIEILYCTDLYEEQSIRQMGTHYCNLLWAAIQDSGMEIARMPMLSAGEVVQLTKGFNQTKMDYPAEMTVTELLASQVARTPGGSAVEHGDIRVSYGELWERSGRLAGRLRTRHCIARNELVGILADRSERMVIGVMGIIRSGGAYVPIDPELPEARIGYILEQSKVRVVVTEERYRELVTAKGYRAVVLRPWADEGDDEAINAAEVINAPEDLLYVMYTSGSTGRPKGVQIGHGSVVNFLWSMQEKLRIRGTERLLAVTTYSFDISVLEMLLPLISGGTVLMLGSEQMRDGGGLGRSITSMRPDLMQCTPAMWQMLLEAGWKGDGRMVALCGGERLGKELAGRLLGEVKELWNMYGPTETTIWSTMHRVREEEDAVVIGRPIANTEIYIMSEGGQLLPVGVAGEIYIGGSGLAQGYKDQAELTKERFVDHPFRPGERLYRTGDIGKWLPGGEVVFIGRRDEQVKIRGHRVELGEIEHVIACHPAVSAAAVVTDSVSEGRHYLVAYVVLTMEVTGAELREHVRRELPEYMAPSYFMVLEYLPLSSNGKVDKKSLREVGGGELLGGRTEYVRAGNAIEAELVRIWEAVLERERIGIADNFFEIGGDAQLVTRVETAVKTHLGVQLSLGEVFLRPTIGELAMVVEKGLAGVTAAPPLERQERSEYIPLSYSQERLWFIDRLQESSLNYSNGLIVQLSGSLNISHLNDALKSIIERHEVLRTVIRQQDTRFYQEIRPSSDWQLKVIRPLGGTEEVKRLVRSEAAGHGFDLSSDYLLKATLIAEGTEEFILIISVHHIAWDGWSWTIFINELTPIYQSLQENLSAGLPELPVQYADYAIWQRATSGRLIEPKLGYWLERLRGVEPLDLPLDYSRPPMQSTRGASYRYLLDRRVSEGVQGLCRREGVTQFMVLLSAFKVLLYRYSGQRDISIGTVVADRPHPAVERLIGFFTNTLVLRTDLSGNPGFTELLTQVKQRMLEAFDHQEVPFELIVDKIVSRRDLSRNPLFDVLFTMNNYPMPSVVELPGLTFRPYPSLEAEATQFDMDINVEWTERGLGLYVVYSKELFRPETIAGMIGHYEELLLSMIAEPSKRIDMLNMVSERERRQLLGVEAGAGGQWFNRGYQELGNEVPFNVRFEEIADCFGDRIAVIQGGEQWSYRRLNRYANQAGHLLRSIGVKPGECVGVYLERGPVLIGCLLGILKAGAVYMPLDTQNPADRIGRMVAGDRVSAILTTREGAAELKRSCSVGRWLPVEEVTGERGENLPNVNRMESWAYVSYTSGSTGEPKGAIVHHRGALNHILAKYVQLEVGEELCFLQTAAIGSDISIWQMLAPLLCGGQVVVMDKHALLDYEQVLATIEAERVSVLEFVPTYLWGLVQYMKGAGRMPQRQSLRWIILTGERVPGELIGELRELFPGVRLLNAYGPCEASDDVLHYEFLLPPDRLYVPIGRPIPNINAVILDKMGSLCGVGVPGELCVSGIGVGYGYLRDEERTARQFVANPFPELLGATLYRTGDLCKWEADGNMVFMGRMDRQVKLRGYRVELGEIASLIRELSFVGDCHLLVQGDQQQGQYLVVFVVLGSGQEEQTAEELLREHCRQGLPVYMQPQYYCFVKEIPTNVSDKANELRLAELFADGGKLRGQQGEQARAFKAPQGPVEEQLASIWQELLGSERIGRDDNFFAIGGHSLLVIRVVTAVKAQMGVQLAVGELFRKPTIGELAPVVEKGLGVAAASPALVRQTRGEYIPLSYSQERLWFIDRLQGSVSYHLPFLLKIRGEIDQWQLQEVFLQLLLRHEVLRTVYRERDGIPYQRVLSGDSWTMEYGSFGEEAGTGADLQAFLSERIGRPFDLSADYMLRVWLIRTGSGEHLLLVVMHHIASDGWSDAILVRELLSLYRMVREGLPMELPPLPVQYADYAIWQRTNGEQLIGSKMAYWERQLKDAEILEMPTDYSRPAVQSTRGAAVQLRVDEALADRLQTLSLEQGVTLFVTLLAAFKVLLYRYTGQQDISVGSPVANRTEKEIEPLVGCFINTVVFRTRLNSLLSFEELMQEVRQTTVGAYEHADVPFEQVIDRVVRERDMSRSPLFQVLFTFNNNEPPARLRVEGIELEELPFEGSATKFDLSFTIGPVGRELQIGIAYSTDLYEERSILQMGTHYLHLLRAAVQDSRMEIGRMPMLSADEVGQLTKGFNQTRVDYPADRTIVDLFEEQAIMAAGQVALVRGKARLSYAELDARADGIADELTARGIGTNGLVAIYLDDPFEALIILMAVLKAGAAYIPIDEDFPMHRVNMVLEDARAALVFTSERMNAAITGNIEQIVIDKKEEKAAVRKGGPGQTAVKPSPSDIAYVIYTSGSTGKPKGVAVTHRNLMDYFYGLFDAIPIAGYSSYALMSTLAADMGLTMLGSALLNGRTLHVFPKDTLRDTETMRAYFRVNAIDCIKVVPSYWKALTGTGDLAVRRMVMFGGEELQKGMVEDLVRSHPGIAVVNHYGPTETTIGKLLHKVDPDRCYDRMPIGMPFSNTQAYVLDANGQLTPVGVRGELYIGGDGVSKGYLNNPEMTEQKFIPDPFIAGNRIYRTGDVVRRQSDGEIVFLGRRDHQVKVRGYRVELGEVEQAMIESQLVHQAIAALRAVAAGRDPSLVAYVVPGDGYTRSLLLERMRQRLPEYMVPSLVMELTQVPLTFNNKVDFRSLPAFADPWDTTGRYEPPRTGIEVAVATIWRSLLGVPQVGRDDDFFGAGGHSLLGARVLSEVRRQLGADLPMRELFMNPVLKDFCRRVAETSGADPMPALTPKDRTQRIPLSYSQERLWFIDLLHEYSLNYHSGMMLGLKGPVHIGHLDDALRAIIDRHEVLRTVIRQHDSVPYQVIRPSDDWHLSSITHQGTAEELGQEIRAVIDRPFDLSTDYVLRARLIAVTGEEFILVIVIHHIAWDGWSRSIFVDELVQSYRSLQEGHAPQLRPLPVQYADYAMWQRHYLPAGRLEEKLSFWLERLRDIQPLDLPLDHSRPKLQSTRGSSYTSLLDKQVSEDLLALSRREGVTLFMVMLSAFKVLLCRYCGQHDIGVGTVIAQRPHPDVEGLIGFFINTLVLRTDLSGDPDFRTVLSRVRQVTLEAYEHQEVPFELIVSKISPQRDMSRHPLFDVIFTFQNNPHPSAVNISGLTLRQEHFPEETTQFDINFNIEEADGELRISIVYSTELFDARTITQLVEHYRNLLLSILEDTAAPISTLNMLDERERQQVLVDFNRTTRAYDLDGSILRLFSRQALLHAEHPALETKGISMTYRELDARSSLLAHLLIDQYGVGRGDLVGILMERCEWAVIALLAVLKAGAAYVPIDPEYPAERKSFIVKQSGLKLLVVLMEKLFGMQYPDGVTVFSIGVQSDDAGLPQALEQPLPELPAGNDLAYVIYTSGSTGRPKGVMIEHGSLLNYAFYGMRTYGRGGEPICCPLFSSLSFDLTQTSIWLPLLTGGVLRIETDNDLTAVLAGILEDRRINTIKLTPAHIAFLPENIPSAVTTVIVGGERLEQTQLSTLMQLNRGLTVFNEYGPTEATIGCSVAALHAAEDLITIGTPIDNTCIYILGTRQEILPAGISGEICIGGAGLARGYLGDGELTGKKFMMVVLQGKEMRLYRSGDKGRWLPDGRLEYLDRLDDQVKIRGYRVEPGEVETVLSQAPGVGQVVVLARKDNSGSHLLTAYIAARAGYDRAMLLQLAERSLPSYMIPSRIVEVEALPLNVNGKVDKAQLLSLDEPGQTGIGVEGPRTGLEARLADIWKELLNVGTIDIRDNFFKLGGHSILAVKVMAAIRRQLGLNLSMVKLFEHPTIESLAAYITAITRTEPSPQGNFQEIEL